MTDAQQELDDEILSACHDGELPPMEAEAVRRRSAREPQLAGRLDDMQYVDRAAAWAFRALDNEPVPGRVLELLAAAETERRERILDSGKPGRPPVAGRTHRTWRWPTVLAVGVALTLGFSLGAVLPDGSGSIAAEFSGQSDCSEHRPRLLQTGAARSQCVRPSCNG